MTQQTAVVLGVDTHKDVHVGVVVDLVGRILGTRSVTTTQVGHDELEQWATSFGPLLRAGIEGACAYGAGLARFLTDRGHQIVEVARPERRVRRREGKHDTIDDREAARAALAGEGTIPKSGQGQVEMIRALRVVRRSAAQARGVVANQLHSLLVTAPQPVRDQLRALPLAGLVAAAAAFDDVVAPDSVEDGGCGWRCASWVRHQALSDQIRRLDGHLDRLTEQTAPRLRALHGVGRRSPPCWPRPATTPTGCAATPRWPASAAPPRLPASSGKTVPHRLNRGGDRQAWRAASDAQARRSASSRSSPTSASCAARMGANSGALTKLGQVSQMLA
jgi:transposase